MINSLLLVLSLVTLTAFIWLVVVAFRRGVLWGLGVFFLSPITAIVFATMHWPQVKRPFLAYIASFSLMLAAGLYISSELGLFKQWNTITDMMAIMARAERDELSEGAALSQVVRGMEQFAEQQDEALKNAEAMGLYDREAEQQKLEQKIAEIEKMEVTSPEQARAKTLMLEALKNLDKDRPVSSLIENITKSTLEGADKTEAIEMPPLTIVENPAPRDTQATITTPPEFHSTQTPRPRATEKPIVKTKSFKVTAPQKAKNYVGQNIIVLLKDGRRLEGYLKRFHSNNIIIEKFIIGGSYEFSIKLSAIDTLEVWR